MGCRRHYCADPVNIEPETLNNPDYINRIGNAIAGLNPQDIERLDILKDAAATASLYGRRPLMVLSLLLRNGDMLVALSLPQYEYHDASTSSLYRPTD